MVARESARVTIVDYGSGNLHSLRKAFERINVSTLLTSDPNEVLRAEKLILPGVGHFGSGMQQLRERNLVEALGEAVRVKEVPVLGICLGMQLFAQSSEEGDATGLGFIDADVVRFKIQDTTRFKVPHVGWNGLRPRKASPLFENLDARSEFYFVHSYHLVSRDESIVTSETEYAYAFASAIEQRNVFGVQPHPEKSHDAGATLLRNFASL